MILSKENQMDTKLPKCFLKDGFPVYVTSSGVLMSRKRGHQKHIYNLFAADD